MKKEFEMQASNSIMIIPGDIQVHKIYCYNQEIFIKNDT